MHPILKAIILGILVSGFSTLLIYAADKFIQKYDPDLWQKMQDAGNISEKSEEK